jgi:hypothetical protein
MEILSKAVRTWKTIEHFPIQRGRAEVVQPPFNHFQYTYTECFGFALTLCGSGSNILGDCGSGFSFENECGFGSWINVKNKNFVKVKKYGNIKF